LVVNCRWSYIGKLVVFMSNHDPYTITTTIKLGLNKSLKKKLGLNNVSPMPFVRVLKYPVKTKKLNPLVIQRLIHQKTIPITFDCTTNMIWRVDSSFLIIWHIESAFFIPLSRSATWMKQQYNFLSKPILMIRKGLEFDQLCLQEKKNI